MFAIANSISIAYEKSGAGPPLVLLHGCTEDRHIFDRLVPGLTPRFTVYAVDSRNHGESGKSADFHYATMADDLLALIDCLGLAPAYVLGFSDGAIVSLMASMKHPESIRKQILLGVNLRPADLTEEGTAFLKDLLDRTGDPRLAIPLQEPDIRLEDAARVAVPTLVAGGENDIIRPESFRELAAVLPNAELLILSGHDHVSYVVDQDILLPDILRFFS
ncbi:MAG: alpha/beta hydrolase [Deltaproteobacteria bacterium]|jgi:pimeloyl-ACP methyl ester carboxylesterase|nr:alpha/beta hydrolase [Deltaproteobacteria bacterium]